MRVYVRARARVCVIYIIKNKREKINEKTVDS